MRLFSAILCFMSILCGGACHASEAPVRGAWVSAWMEGYFTPQQVDATIQSAKKAHLNTLFIQVRKVADAYYDSAIEPRGTNLASDFDPLADVIKKAHAEGIAVHAWVNVCRVWVGKSMPTDPFHLVCAHPGWLNRDYSGKNRALDGMFIDPGVPEARNYVAALIKDIASRYDIDGVHLDYIRYPGQDWGYSEEAIDRYMESSRTDKKPTPGDSKWSQWRRDQVTEMLRQIRREVKSVRPKAQVSAATIAWMDCPSSFSSSLAYKKVFQDWQRWLSDGLLDVNVPMNYRCDDKDKCAVQFRDWLRGFKCWDSKKPTLVGIDVYNNNPEAIKRQIGAVNKAGLKGFVLFSFNEGPARKAIMSALEKKTF